MKRILITGGAGFIGSNLVEYFNTHSPSTEVAVIDDLSTGFLENLSAMDCNFYQHSILDYNKLKKAAYGADSIIHLGAIGSVPRSVANPRPSHDANATGTFNVLEVARETGISHVVVASSSSVYGSNPALPKKEMDWTRPLSPYAASKLATEAYALSYQSSYGLKTLAFRFFNVYGPRQSATHDYAAVIPRFIASAIATQPLTVYGDGNQSRDFTYVESVCSALYKSVLRVLHQPQPVNLAFGTNTSLLKLIEIISDQLHRPLHVKHEAPRAGDVLESQADPTVLRDLLPSVEPTALHVGISKTIEWFVKQKTI